MSKKELTLEEAENIVDNMYQKRWVECGVEDGNTIHMGNLDKLHYSELERASILLLRTEMRLKRENKKLKTLLKGTTHCYDEVEHKQLMKENKELKKQLEEIDSKLFFTKNELEMRQKSIDNKLRQQKEFIEWLERRLFLLRDVASELALGMCSTDYQDVKIEVYQEILSKYKEIIGVKDE